MSEERLDIPDTTAEEAEETKNVYDTNENMNISDGEADLEETPREEPNIANSEKITHTDFPKYIHIGCDEDDEAVDIFSNSGFESEIYYEKADITKLRESIHSSSLVIIFESSDVFSGNQNMGYRIREAISAKKNVIIVIRREFSDFARKFESERGVAVVSYTSEGELLHKLFVENLCKMQELYTDDDCVRDEYGNIIHHAIDAHMGVAASERFLAECYMSGEVLPKLPKTAVYWYSRAREHGSVKSVVALGECYFTGNGCPRNVRKAYECFSEACEQNSPEGFLRRGICLYLGEGCSIDYDKAYEHFKRALHLRKDFPEAEYYIALCLRDGHGVEESYSEAKSHFLKSAKGNFTPAFIALGNLFSENVGDDHNLTLAYEYYSRAAANGSLEGLYKKGLALSSGNGCTRDVKAAYHCFLEGAQRKDAACMCSLGMCYEFGVGCEMDLSRAVDCYISAAESGNPAAMNNLGGCYYYGHGVGMDRAKAMECFERAAAFGDSNAATRMGIFYEQGIDCEKDEKKAFEYYKRAAENNNAIGAYKLALCYESGIGTRVDFKQAFECFELSAGLGYSHAMWHVANYMSDGIGTEKDLWGAYKWYCRGAEMGDAKCYIQMAHFSFKGIGTAKNYTRAFYAYNKAYELGDKSSDTALRIGICHLRGLGTKEDGAAALLWFKRAAAQNNADAIFLCGESYYYGSGCEQSYDIAVRYYASAVNLGHVRATIELASCYENGFGVEKSIKRAVTLYKRASDYDHPEANFKIAELMYKNHNSLTSARPLLFKASGKGYIPAVLLLGILYDEGIGIPANSDKAAEKYYEVVSLSVTRKKSLLFAMPARDAEKRKVISEATIEATYRLGMLKGKHAKTIEEYTQAFEYLAGAAATGSRRAQVEIARIYASGGDLHTYFHTKANIPEPDHAAIADAMNKLGDTWHDGKPLLPKNDRAAVKCYRIAAEMGQSDAEYSLGWCLRHGVGTKVDDVEAAKWLKRSADKGNPYAAYSYGLCCEEGSGMQHPNLRDAATYYRKAAAAGHTEAKKRHLKIIERKS